MIAHINIGSNQGNRTANLARAVDLLSHLGKVEAVSSTVASAPWGYDSDAEFLNIGVNLQTELPAEELLRRLQEIEQAISPSGTHRDESGNYIDRVIDLDLIAYGDMQLETETLTLPHPRMHLRRFVLEPMAELIPQWRHPKNGQSCREMLQSVQ